MIQEHKELLIKDLCARLPYGVKYMKYSWGYDLDQEIPEVEVLECVDKNGYISHTKVYTVEDIKPYLFPLSAMTIEQRQEFDSTLKYLQMEEIDIWTTSTYDWCNKNHFDYRGLIYKGLAIDATNKNIY